MKKVILLLLAVALVLSACGGAAPSGNSGGQSQAGSSGGDGKDQVNLRVAWWGGQARHDYTLKVIELYQKKHPNVKITPEYASFDEYWKKLAPQAAANDLPDVISMDISYLAQYAGRGQLEELDPLIQKGLFDKSSINQTTLDGGKYNGKQYAITLGVNALATTLDVDALKKAGIDAPSKDWTFDDLLKMAPKLKAANKLLTMDFKPEVFFSYYLRTVGQHLYSNDGAALGYTDDKYFVDYFKMYQGLYDAGLLAKLDKVATNKRTPEEDLAATGEAVSTFAWSNQFALISQVAKRNLEIHPMPGPGAKQGLFMKPSMYFTIAKNSKQKEEAMKFIDFWTNDVEANQIIKGERGIPISSKIKDSLKPTLDATQTKVFDYITWAEQNSSPLDPPEPVGAAEITKLINDLNEQILYKKTTPEDAAAKFRKDASAILAKNKK
ncbi:ABC transporter substrate-binding protein [Paenibacillus sp. y28]|uniref:ABC transporter substrate-binding protein n=1 Tax=Paenibacillus sp. y28 TaxID=3129110 RepID=UPI00301AFB47